MVSAMVVGGTAEGILVRLGHDQRDAETNVVKVLGARDKAKAKKKKSDLEW